MGDRTPRDIRLRPYDVRGQQPANLLGNVTRLLADCGGAMLLYVDGDAETPIDAEAFAMGVVYAALFAIGSRDTAPTLYIDAMRTIGVME